MSRTRAAARDRLRGVLQGALAAVFLAAGGCTLVLDTSDLDRPDAEGPGLTDAAADAAGESDGDVLDAAADARPTGDAAPSDARGEAAPDAEAGADAGRRDAGGTDDGASDATPDAPDDGGTDAPGPDAPVTDDGGTDASGPAPDAGSDACALVTHTNGVGGTWQDCAALGTHNRTEAQSACAALATTDQCVAQNACNFSYVGVSLSSADAGMTTYLWIYATQNGARSNPGDVLVYPSGSAQCNNLPRRAATWR